MYRKIAVASSLFAFFSASIISQKVNAAGVNNVYYSAAMCKPVKATRSNNQTDLEFQDNEGQTDNGRIIGGWFNRDQSNKEILICPVPYDKFNTKKFIVVRVVVEDGSNDLDETGSVDIQLCGQPAEGATVCPKSVNQFSNITRGELSTSRGGVGISTLSVNIQPRLDQQDLRWFWFKVSLPDVDSASVTARHRGVSKVLGYRVLRCPARGSTGNDRFIPDCSGVN